jgi:hypothetical protein
VAIDGTMLQYGGDWELVDNTTLRLKGSACDKLKSEPNAHVTATFPCSAIIY